MPQSLILMKSLPDPNYLHDLQERGVYRASMNFLPGGCYAGAALWDASSAYSPRSADTSTMADGTCPDPMDTTACLLWDVFEIVQKVSHGMPQIYNLFVFLRIRAGLQHAWAGQVREVAADAGDSAYIAAGHLLGCGPYNAVLEVLSDEHEQLQDIAFRLTDVDGVEEIAVGRVNAEDARGWGDPEPGR